MSECKSRPLHLHTLDSLIADLVSGRSVQTGGGRAFVLPDERTRSALEWYRKKGSERWAANVSAVDGEDLVKSILLQPPQLARVARAPRRLKQATLATEEVGGT